MKKPGSATMPLIADDPIVDADGRVAVTRSGYVVFVNSTRRLFALPSGVSFESTGFVDP
jgi:hypothetical protein